MDRISSDIAIRVDGLSKLYRIGAREAAYDSVGGAMIDIIKSPVKNYRKYRSLYNFSDLEKSSPQANDPSIIWALNDVSFEVACGEVLGVIGQNGAGKSTLLKILSKITPPTNGQVQIRGRVSSLLEVGTGFHQELTGRENVYLNGTVLGMRKKEVDRKFDEIVDFSGVEKFLDTPVKRYSSGMRVRLAFAVAAHLEPEILVVDEVLAVGDAAFQKKCMNKMQDVGQHGRTVLLVSHNMPAVTRLCPRVLMFDQGRLARDGDVAEVVDEYLKSGLGTSPERVWADLSNAPGDEVVRLCSMRVTSENGQPQQSSDIRHPIGLEMEYEVLKPGKILLPYFVLSTEQGTKVFSAIDQDVAWRDKTRETGRYTSTAWIPGNLLSEGVYYVSVAMRSIERKIRHFNQQDIVAFNVIDRQEGDTARGDWTGRLTGIVRPQLAWETRHRPIDMKRSG